MEASLSLVKQPQLDLSALSSEQNAGTICDLFFMPGITEGGTRCGLRRLSIKVALIVVVVLESAAAWCKVGTAQFVPPAQ